MAEPPCWDGSAQGSPGVGAHSARGSTGGAPFQPPRPTHPWSPIPLPHSDFPEEREELLAFGGAGLSPAPRGLGPGEGGGRLAPFLQVCVHQLPVNDPVHIVLRGEQRELSGHLAEWGPGKGDVSKGEEADGVR